MKLTYTDTNAFVHTQISQARYHGKPSPDDIRRMEWDDCTVTVKELRKHIKAGHTFVPFEREKDNCISCTSNVLFVDFDHVDYDMESRLRATEYKPTIAYETYSDSPDDHRYRFVYVFDSEYTGGQFESLRDIVAKECGLDDYDKRSVNQYYNGTSEGKRIYVSGCVYALPEGLSETGVDKVPGGKTKRSQRGLLFSRDVWSLFWRVGFLEFRNRCFEDIFAGLEFPKETPYVKRDDERILERPDNFVRVPVKYRWDKTLKQKMVVKWTDGERRHERLFNSCMAWRHINPSITADELLYYLVDYFLTCINNSDRKFNKKDLITTVTNSMKADAGRPMKVGKAAEYHVDEAYCVHCKCSKREVANRVNNEKRTRQKIQRYEEIDRHYDPSKSIRQNMESLQDKGIYVSIGTLQAFTKWRKSKCSIPRP